MANLVHLNKKISLKTFINCKKVTLVFHAQTRLRIEIHKMFLDKLSKCSQIRINKIILFNSINSFHSTNKSNENKANVFLVDKYNSFRTEQIILMSYKLKEALSHEFRNLKEEKVAVLGDNNYSYLISLFAVWLLNGIPVLLHKRLSHSQIEQALKETKCTHLIKPLNPIEYYDYSSKKETELDLALNKTNVQTFRLAEHEFYRAHRNNFNSSNDGYNLNKEIFLWNCIYSKTSNTTACSIIGLNRKNNQMSPFEYKFADLINSLNQKSSQCKLDSSSLILNAIPFDHTTALVNFLVKPFVRGVRVEILGHLQNEREIWSKLLTDKLKIDMFVAHPGLYSNLVRYFKLKLSNEIHEEHIKRGFRGKPCWFASSNENDEFNTKLKNEWYELTGCRIAEISN